MPATQQIERQVKEPCINDRYVDRLENKLIDKVIIQMVALLISFTMLKLYLIFIHS